MAPGLDLELTPLGANGEAEPRTRFYGTGPSFSPARLTMNPPECTMKGSWCQIPVGTALAGGPPDRSQRAELLHWAPALGRGDETHVGVGMHDAGGR
jgi:hypothetical protein